MLSKLLSILFNVYSTKWLKVVVSVQDPRKKNIPHSLSNLKSTQSEEGKLRGGVEGGWLAGWLVSRGRGGEEAEILL